MAIYQLRYLVYNWILQTLYEDISYEVMYFHKPLVPVEHRYCMVFAYIRGWSWNKILLIQESNCIINIAFKSMFFFVKSL